MIAVPNLYLLRVKTHSQQAHSNWKPGVIAHSVAPRSYIATSIATIESACVTPFSPVNPETATSPTNKNVSQDDSSDIPPLP